MFGYVYQITNTQTGEFYIGKRSYDMDKRSGSTDVYMGSSPVIAENIDKYGIENFVKVKLCECETEQDAFDKESEFLMKNSNNPLLLNKLNGIGWGGVYKRGICSKCGKIAPLYHDDLCMSCIKGHPTKEYCEVCGRDTYHYENGKCRSCASRESHNLRWCDFCQAYTTHMGGKCKRHQVKLRKVDDKVQLVLTGTAKEYVVLEDISALDDVCIDVTPKSVKYNLPEGLLQIKSNNTWTGLKALLYNESISDWLKVTYRYDERQDHTRSIILTTDHPLPLFNGKVVYARELQVGDWLKRVNPKKMGNMSTQWPYAEITQIEPVQKTARSYDVTTETEYFDINGDILSHNCRSFLTPYVDENGKPKYYGRFNAGVCTLNLPDVALSALQAAKENNTDKFDEFWTIFDDRLELCHRGLQCRHQRLRGTLSDVSPIHWQYGALARLKKGEPIDKLLFNNYSTISLGYAGLYECVKAMTGKSHTDEVAKDFALDIMRKMNEKCSTWRAEEHISYSLYGTPIESTTEKFAQCLQKRFGVIEGITDHGYITNSYHVNVREKIDPFTKLRFEAEFQALSPGGAISYIETGHLDNNIPAVLAVMRYIYDNILYAELNTKSDYCQECGYSGDIQVVEQGNKLVWRCPNCGNTNQDTMNVARRTCGYIGSQYWCGGRTEEIRDRYVHLGGDGIRAVC